jgi:hypothetical protein
LNSNTTPTGTFTVYDPIDALFIKADVVTARWVPIRSGGYAYEQSPSSVPSGIMFQIPTNATLGIWSWNAAFTDGTDQQTFTGTFTVVARN